MGNTGYVAVSAPSIVCPCMDRSKHLTKLCEVRILPSFVKQRKNEIGSTTRECQPNSCWSRLYIGCLISQLNHPCRGVGYAKSSKSTLDCFQHRQYLCFYRVRVHSPFINSTGRYMMYRPRKKSVRGGRYKVADNPTLQIKQGSQQTWCLVSNTSGTTKTNKHIWAHWWIFLKGQ